VVRNEEHVKQRLNAPSPGGRRLCAEMRMKMKTNDGAEKWRSFTEIRMKDSLAGKRKGKISLPIRS
jgi:hypothetical protein